LLCANILQESYSGSTTLNSMMWKHMRQKTLIKSIIRSQVYTAITWTHEDSEWEIKSPNSYMIANFHLLHMHICCLVFRCLVLCAHTKWTWFWYLFAYRITTFRNTEIDKWQRKIQVTTGAAALKGKLHAFNQVAWILYLATLVTFTLSKSKWINLNPILFPLVWEQNISDQVAGYMRDPSRMINRMYLTKSAVGVFGEVLSMHLS